MFLRFLSFRWISTRKVRKANWELVITEMKVNNCKKKVNKQLNYGWQPLWWASYQITVPLCFLKKCPAEFQGKLRNTLTQLIKVCNCQLKIHLCFSCNSRTDSNENTIPLVFQKPSVAEIWIEHKSLPRASPQCFPSLLPLVIPLVTPHHSSVGVEMGKREMTLALVSDLKKYHHRN